MVPVERMPHVNSHQIPTSLQNSFLSKRFWMAHCETCQSHCSEMLRLPTKKIKKRQTTFRPIRSLKLPGTTITNIWWSRVVFSYRTSFLLHDRDERLLKTANVDNAKRRRTIISWWADGGLGTPWRADRRIWTILFLGENGVLHMRLVAAE